MAAPAEPDGLELMDGAAAPTFGTAEKPELELVAVLDPSLAVAASLWPLDAAMTAPAPTVPAVVAASNVMVNLRTRCLFRVGRWLGMTGKLNLDAQVQLPVC